MSEWYYTENSQQAGPVDVSVLREKLSSGALPAGTLVFGPGLTQWMPATQVAALGGSGFQPATTGVPLVDYQGIETAATGLSETALRALMQTKPWVRFMAVMNFIGAGLTCLGGLSVMTASLATHSSKNPLPLWLGPIYLLGAMVYIPLGLLLNRYASAIAAVMRTRQTSDVEKALLAQKSFWRFLGILVIVILVLYFLAIAVVMILAMLRLL